MAVPKQRKSASRRDMRRKANWRLKAPNMVECPHCHAFTLPHRVCSECGYYKGKKVMEVAE